MKVIRQKAGELKKESKDALDRGYLFIDVATCGWWEMGNFKALIPIFENLAEDGSVEFAGAVLRPHASLMRKEGPKVDEVKEALRRSGKELAENGTLSPELLETIRQPLISEEEYRRDLNEDYLERK